MLRDCFNGPFGKLRLDKRRCDRRTNDLAQDGLLAPAVWQPSGRIADWSVLRQSESDWVEDRGRMAHADRCDLCKAARAGDRRPIRYQVAGHGVAPPWPRPGRMQTGKTDHAISAPHRMRRNYTQTIRATLGLVPQAVRATSSTRSTTCDIAKGGEHSPYSRCPLITPVSGPAGLTG